ncbi:MAG: SusC/RagA family TonB-linked outer membrane protein [Bacteroidales bacterium]
MKLLIRSNWYFVLLLLCNASSIQSHQFSISLVSPPAESPKWSLVTGSKQYNSGFIWFTADKWVHNHDGYKITTYLNELQNPKSLEQNLTAFIRTDSSDIVCIGTSGSAAFYQSIISGTVRGNDGLSLPGATVAVIGTNNFTVTDADGRYSILANKGDTIEVSFIGYISYQFVAGNQTNIDITLIQSPTMLEEVMVVGYGIAQRKDLTGSVAKVSSDAFVAGSISNPLQQIQGKIPGVVITQAGGDPNGDPIVRIRGSTSLEGQPPLLVIDGVAIDDFYKSINTLNPSDIESYDVLKDASAAAIYGARGANGVILITTKRGKAGKISVEYQGYSGFEIIANQLDILTADEWREATKEMNTTSLDLGANTNWQDVISQTGFLHSHTIGISGGSEKINFRGSVGYLKQQGVIVNTGKEMLTSRLSANQKSFNDRLEVTYGINTSLINRDFLPDQSSTALSRTGQTQIPNYGDQGGYIFNLAMSYLPVWPEFNSDGTYYASPSNSANPSFVVHEATSMLREIFFQSSVKADYKVFKGLKLGLLGAVSTGSETYDRFWPPLPNSGGLAIATKSENNKFVFTGDIHGNYLRTFDKHTVELTVVYEYNKFVNNGFSVTAEGFLIPELLTNNLGTATSISTTGISSFKNEVRLISFLGRLVYNYDDRYLFTANFRRDGSSKFGPNNRWGNFPSFAIAWRASNETFMRNATWLNLKLRASYGYTGNQENLEPYQYQTLYSPSGPYLYNGQFLQSYAVTQESNADLKWEVRKSFNAGLDFAFWKDRLYGTIDVFNDKTNDLLFTYGIPQPPFLTNQVIANAASAVNKGVEITLGGSIIKKQNYNWNLVGNIGVVNNYITELLGTFKGFPLTLSNRSYGYATGGALGQFPVTRLEVGYPAGVIWIPQHAGFDASGNELFNDYDADGNFVGTTNNYSNLTDEDFKYIDPTPDFTWGITSNFTFGNFDLSFFIRGAQGQKIFANTLLQYGSTAYLPGQNVADQALSNGFVNLPYPSTYWLRNGSFARLENLNLGYRFTSLKGFNNFHVYLAAANLFVISNYDGIDPEIRTEGSQRYIDANYYPKTRSITMGINFGF